MVNSSSRKGAACVVCGGVRRLVRVSRRPARRGDVYALTDYREVDRSIALARVRT